MSDYGDLDAFERRGDDYERFAEAKRQADEYIQQYGSDKLVEELRGRLADRRPVRFATINALILVHHIDSLERELRDAGLTVRK